MRLLLILALAGVCFAQTPAPPAPAAAALPDDGVMAGAGYGTHLTAWASYFQLVSTKGQVYSFSTYDAQRLKDATTGKPTLVTSARSGFATILKVYGPVYIIGFATAGGAATSTSFSGSFGGGGIAVLRIGKTGWILGPGIRRSTSALTGAQTFYEFGFGRVKTP